MQDATNQGVIRTMVRIGRIYGADNEKEWDAALLRSRERHALRESMACAQTRLSHYLCGRAQPSTND